jgi:hypothetical protein
MQSGKFYGKKNPGPHYSPSIKWYYYSMTIAIDREIKTKMSCLVSQNLSS